MSSRRTHSKSRNGCKECKRRKVKCDESHPCCFNCARHGVVCSLGTSDFGDGVIPNLTYLPTNVDPFTALSNLTNLLDNSHNRGAAVTATDPEQEAYAFELTHHYCTYTADTFAYRDDIKQVWKIHIPELGYRCKYVMYSLMAIAALHKAALMPSQSEKYMNQAAYYQTLGLQHFLADIRQLDDGIWEETFCFSSIVVLYGLCSPALWKKEALASPLQITMDMFTFVRGPRAIIMPFRDRLGTTKLRPLGTAVFVVDEKDPLFTQPNIENSSLPNDTFEALDKLGLFCEQVAPTRQGDYRSAVDGMIRAGYHVAHAGMQPELGTAMFWAFLAPDSIMADIQAADPFGLVVLGHYAVFFAILEPRFWFFSGWPRLLFRAIDENLIDNDGSFREALAWPRKQIFETFASTSMG